MKYRYKIIGVESCGMITILLRLNLIPNKVVASRFESGVYKVFELESK